MTSASVIFPQKSPSEGNFVLWYSEYISQPVLYYFDLSKEVESVLWPEFLWHKYLDFYISEECVYFCHRRDKTKKQV